MKELSVRIHAASGVFKTTTPYNKEFLGFARTAKGHWNKEEKVWEFGLTHLDYITNAIVRCYSAEPKIIHSDEAVKKSAPDDEEKVVIVSTEEMPDWKTLDSEALLNLYLEIEEELRKRNV